MSTLTETTSTATETVQESTVESDTMRIPHILARLERYWMKNPELRLGQILGNVGTTKGIDSYYLSDEKLAEYLEQEAPRWDD